MKAFMCHVPVRAHHPQYFVCFRLFSALPKGVEAVSSHGRVQSKSGIIHWGTKSPSGYHVTCIGGKKNQVHRLVAAAFLPPMPTPDHCDVNHKDGDKSNNHFSNLEYMTRAQNIQHSYDTNPARRTGADATSKPVHARRLGEIDWTTYRSITEAARRLNLPPGRVCLCCKGMLTSTRGFEFRYAAPNVPVLLPGEQWKPALHPETGAPLAPRKVSCHGRIESSLGIISCGTRRLCGYMTACVYNHGRVKSFLVHRLIARAFLGPPPDSTNRWLVNHKDGDKSNNHAANLEYATVSQNVAHHYRLRGSNRKSLPAMSIPVLGRQIGLGSWSFYPSMNDAARQLNLPSGSVSSCCSGRVRRAGQYEFRYAERQIPRVLSGEEWRRF